MNPRDQHLSLQFTARCEESRAALRKHMAERGLRTEDGWWIHEFIRPVNGVTELVMRPMHRQLTVPPDIECLCAIDEHGTNAISECRDQVT